MNRIDVTLLVALKGADLYAATAALALHDKMGYEDELIGLKRMDYFRLTLESEAAPERAIENLRKVLGRQSTFYNRNKHLYVLEWEAGEAGSGGAGEAREALLGRWQADLARHLQNKGSVESGGKDPANGFILGGSKGFLVQALIEDDDTSTRDTIAAKVQTDLAGLEGSADVKATCQHRGAVWWLALFAPDAAGAQDMARHITVTQRRDSGLLMNPHYQRAEFEPARPL
jgi:hypothetical protein